MTSRWQQRWRHTFSLNTYATLIVASMRRLNTATVSRQREDTTNHPCHFHAPPNYADLMAVALFTYRNRRP